MKIRIFLVIALLTIFLSACQPKPTGFTGTWFTNIALVSFTQEGDIVTGRVEGYGGYWSFELSGAVTDSTLTFDGDTPLGPLAIVLARDSQTFQSADPSVSFCGSRAAELPDGCGFTGTWNLKSDLVPEGSLAKLTQSGSSITGAVYGPDKKEITSLNGAVEWGKGWQGVGTNDWGDFVLSMTADEKAFQVAAGDQFGNEWCGLRKGESSAYVMFFTCTVP
jgi:hypothetical protein